MPSFITLTTHVSCWFMQQDIHIFTNNNILSYVMNHLPFFQLLISCYSTDTIDKNMSLGHCFTCLSSWKNTQTRQKFIQSYLHDGDVLENTTLLQETPNLFLSNAYKEEPFYNGQQRPLQE